MTIQNFFVAPKCSLSKFTFLTNLSLTKLSLTSLAQFTLSVALTLCFTCVVPVAKAAPITSAELENALVKLLEEKPEIIFNVMKNNSLAFINTVTQASEKARTQKLHEEWQKDLDTKRKMEITNRPLQGNVTAKHTVIGYSDFLCSFCAQAATTMEGLIKKRDDVKFIFKGVPTNEASRTAMKWFYVLYEKDSKKAWQFHDSIFANQKAFASNHKAVIHELVQRLGFNPIDLEREMVEKDKVLNARIDTDIKELADMGLSGTPNFIVNNVSIKGAYPVQVFEDAIKFTEEHTK